MTTAPRAGADIDGLARRLHAEAVQRVPWQTLARLRAGPGGAVPARRTPATRHGRVAGWSLAMAGAGLFAVAVALRLGPGMNEVEPLPLAVDPGAGQGAEDGYGSVFTALEEDPDFYLWLANTSVQPLAME
jgi:hypothetical protein